MQNKLFLSLVLSVFFVSFVSAITIYSGECGNLTFPNDQPVEWNVTGNSSDLNGFSFNKTGNIITYCFHPLYKPDNFTITFYNYESVVIDGGSGGGSSGGSHCSYDKNYDWECGEWGGCVNGIQYRECKERNNCGSVYGRPETERNCPIDESEETEEEIVVKKSFPLFWWLFFLVVDLVTLVVFWRYYSRNKKKESGLPEQQNIS